MPFFIARHARSIRSGSLAEAGTVVVDNEPFETKEAAAQVASVRYPAEECLVVEADDPARATFKGLGRPEPPNMPRAL